VFEMWLVVQRIALKHNRRTWKFWHACICTAPYYIITNLSTQGSFYEILSGVSKTGIRVLQSCEMSQFIILKAVWQFSLTCPVRFWLVISSKLIPASYW
jgi:hypothetical protein